MARNLFLIRHAEAEADNIDIEDINRPLALEGIQNASKIGKFLSQQKLRPDIIISSPALRALSTAELLAEQISYDPSRIHINDHIYEASVRTLMKVLNLLKDDYQTIFLIGHNPSISFVSEYVTGSEIGNIAPGGVIQIRFKIRFWAEVASEIGELVSYDYPDNIKF